MQQNLEHNLEAKAKILKGSEGKEPVTVTHPKVLSVPVHNQKGEVVSYRQYKLTSELLGKGSYGEVYKAYFIDPKVGVCFNQPMAVKFFVDRPGKTFEDLLAKAKAEAEIFGRYYKAEMPIVHVGKIYFVMEFLPGNDLFGSNEELSPEFQNLSFGTTLELLFKLSAAINSIHNKTAKGQAVAHGDLKGSNIKVFIDEQGRVHVNLYDFGHSEVFKKKNDNEFVDKEMRCGTPLYVPVEANIGKRNLKSDIYPLAAIWVTLLGGTEPFSLKDVTSEGLAQAAEVEALNATNGSEDEDEIYFDRKTQEEERTLISDPVARTKYAFDNFMSKFQNEESRLSYPITDLLEKFINRMQEEHYIFRPDSTELLTFSGALYNYYLISQEIISKNDELKKCKTATEHLKLQSSIQGLKETLQRHYGTMILIAYNFWNKNSSIYLRRYAFTNSIIDLHRSKRLTLSVLQQIGRDSDRNEQLIIQTQTRINGLNKIGFSKNITDYLEILCEKSPGDIDDTITSFAKYSELQITQLNKIMEHLNNLGVYVRFSSFEQIISKDQFDILFVAKLCVQSFIERPEINKAGWIKSIQFLGSDRNAMTIASAKKLLANIENSKNIISETEYKMLLSETSLGPILTDLNIWEKLSQRPAIPVAKP